jgi:hypothetical protein
MSQKDPQGAAKAWRRFIDLHQPFETRYLFQYLKFLTLAKDQARIAWQRAPFLIERLSPSSNLIVNGQFSQDVLNGRLNWNYQLQQGVTLTLDPTQFHSGQRSLRSRLTARAFVMPVSIRLGPSSPIEYEFGMFYKSGEIQCRWARCHHS